MNQILLSHACQYPKMTPQDAVKLLYQSHFGGGHLIRNENACLQYLLQEYAATPQRPDAPLFDEIGNGMVRIHLAALDAHGYTPEELCRDFIRSASRHRGNSDSFRADLAVLARLTRENRMPFSPAALEAYLKEYENAGFPVVSHSADYRRHYSPAYRVLEKALLPARLSGNL